MKTPVYFIEAAVKGGLLNSVEAASFAAISHLVRGGRRSMQRTKAGGDGSRTMTIGVWERGGLLRQEPKLERGRARDGTAASVPPDHTPIVMVRDPSPQGLIHCIDIRTRRAFKNLFIK